MFANFIFRKLYFLFIVKKIKSYEKGGSLGNVPQI